VFERAILSPSDVTRVATTPSKIRVGGRIVSGSASTFTLGDALGTIALETSRDELLAPGFLVVFDGTWDGQVLRAAMPIWHQATEITAADGEFARLAWQGTGQRLAQRSVALREVRSHFATGRFVEVQTPTRVRAPGLDANVEPIRAQGGWLVTSPELHLKRLLAGGMPRVFEIAHCHRDEEIGRYHEPEFTLIEWYRAFEPVEAVMRDTEQLVQLVVQRLAGRTVVEHAGRHVNVEIPFARLSVAEAFKRYAQRGDGNELAERDPDQWFRLWVELIEPAIAEFQRPVFVIDYPISHATMARPKAENPQVAERFELYCAGVELCNGYGELTDSAEQASRMRQEVQSRLASGQPELPIDQRFISALHEGLPPCSGNALGFDRLVMLATGAQALADVVAFPWDRN
jgi:lysyl-tRNA synthetase class 2